MIVPAVPPFNPSAATTFYKDVAYGNQNRNVLDVWRPDTLATTPVVVGFHGGGFVSGSKESFYSTQERRDEIEHYLSQGITFIAVNYRYIGTQTDTEGVTKCYDDAEQALRYIHLIRDELQLDTESVGLIGASAGAAICQQMAFKETSVIVRAIGIEEVQSTYNFFRWESILSAYSFNFTDYIERYGTWPSTLTFLGLRSINQLGQQVGRDYLVSIDTLGFMSDYQGEIWVSSTIYPDTNYGSDLGHLYHHPRHAKALRESAQANSIPVVANIPEVGIMSNVTREDFMTSRLS